MLVEPGRTSGRFDGEVVELAVGQVPGDDARAQALHGLRTAMLGAGEVNHVSEVLRGR
jgi:hypothetical protein